MNRDRTMLGVLLIISLIAGGASIALAKQERESFQRPCRDMIDRAIEAHNKAAIEAQPFYRDYREHHRLEDVARMAVISALKACHP